MQAVKGPVLASMVDNSKDESVGQKRMAEASSSSAEPEKKKRGKKSNYRIVDLPEDVASYYEGYGATFADEEPEIKIGSMERDQKRAFQQQLTAILLRETESTRVKTSDLQRIIWSTTPPQLRKMRFTALAGRHKNRFYDGVTWRTGAELDSAECGERYKKLLEVYTAMINEAAAEAKSGTKTAVAQAASGAGAGAGAGAGVPVGPVISVKAQTKVSPATATSASASSKPKKTPLTGPIIKAKPKSRAPPAIPSLQPLKPTPHPFGIRQTYMADDPREHFKGATVKVIELHHQWVWDTNDQLVAELFPICLEFAQPSKGPFWHLQLDPPMLCFEASIAPSAGIDIIGSNSDPVRGLCKLPLAPVTAYLSVSKLYASIKSARNALTTGVVFVNGQPHGRGIVVPAHDLVKQMRNLKPSGVRAVSFVPDSGSKAESSNAKTISPP